MRTQNEKGVGLIGVLIIVLVTTVALASVLRSSLLNREAVKMSQEQISLKNEIYQLLDKKKAALVACVNQEIAAASANNSSSSQINLAHCPALNSGELAQVPNPICLGEGSSGSFCTASRSADKIPKIYRFSFTGRDDKGGLMTISDIAAVGYASLKQFSFIVRNETANDIYFGSGNYDGQVNICSGNPNMKLHFTPKNNKPLTFNKLFGSNVIRADTSGIDPANFIVDQNAGKVSFNNGVYPGASCPSATSLSQNFSNLMTDASTTRIDPPDVVVQVEPSTKPEGLIDADLQARIIATHPEMNSIIDDPGFIKKFLTGDKGIPGYNTLIEQGMTRANALAYLGELYNDSSVSGRMDYWTRNFKDYCDSTEHCPRNQVSGPTVVGTTVDMGLDMSGNCVLNTSFSMSDGTSHSTSHPIDSNHQKFYLLSPTAVQVRPASAVQKKITVCAGKNAMLITNADVEMRSSSIQETADPDLQGSFSIVSTNGSIKIATPNTIINPDAGFSGAQTLGALTRSDSNALSGKKIVQQDMSFMAIADGKTVGVDNALINGDPAIEGGLGDISVNGLILTDRDQPTKNYYAQGDRIVGFDNYLTSFPQALANDPNLAIGVDAGALVQSTLKRTVDLPNIELAKKWAGAAVTAELTPPSTKVVYDKRVTEDKRSGGKESTITTSNTVIKDDNSRK